MNTRSQVEARKEQASARAPVPSSLSQHVGGDGGSAGSTAEYAESGAGRMAQRKHTETSSAPPSVEAVPDSPGQPLDAGSRSLVEPRLGHDFSRVRVHTDARAAESARAVDAAAYTVGSEIVFGSGAYRPQTPRGMQLITHELVHVMQHQAGSVGADAPLSSDVSDPAEQQADSITQQLSSGLPAGQWTPVAPSSRLSLAPETWYRGEGVAVSVAHDASAETRGVVHDLGDGKYLTNRLDVAKEYAELRAPNAALQRVSKGLVDPHSLGKVLDLTKEPGFMNHFKFVKERLPSVSGEPYRRMVDGFLEQKGLKLENFDIIIGPEGIRDGKQMCIRNPKVVAKVLEEMALMKPGGEGGGPGPVKADDELPPTVRTPKTQQAQEPVVEPTTGGAKRAPASATEPQAGGAQPRVGQGRAGRIAIGVGKFAGPIILDLVNRYFMAKAEHQRAVAQISARVESAEVQQWIAELVEKQRLEIARKQYRGGHVYATVSMKLAFTNDVLDQLSLTRLNLSDRDESNLMSSVMSHGGIMGDTGSVWWVDVSLPLPQVELSKSEAIKFHLEMMEANAPGETGPERKRLLGELQQAEQEEAEARQKELESSSVLADPKKRARQQSELSEQLRRLDEKRKAAAPGKKEDAPKQPPGPSSLMPQRAAPQPALLPGAPGPSPITQASTEVQGFRTLGQRLIRKGTALLNRLHSGPDVSQIERQAFRDEVEQWQLAVKYRMNELQGKGREEAVRELMELLENSVAPKLTQMRVYLGVE